jgi:hypothetical protein
MKTIGFLMVLILPSIVTYGQLKLKSAEKNVLVNLETVVDEATGAILTENMIPSEEYIVHAFNSVVYTRQEHPIHTERTEPLRKYSLANGSVAEVASFQIPIHAYLTFFNTGGFALIEVLGEGGGYGNEIRVYNSDFKLIQTFSPYISGIERVKFDTDGNDMMIGITSRGGTNSKFIVIDNEGKKLTEKGIDSEKGEFADLLLSSGFYCIRTNKFNPYQNTISMYDSNGNSLWSKGTPSPVAWSLVKDTKTLVMANNSSLLVYEAENGNQLYEKKIAAIYDEAGVRRLRADGFAITHLMPMKNGNMIVQFSETEGKNNLLYIFNKVPTSLDQKIPFGDSKTALKVKLTSTGFIAIKDNEIMKFDYANKK